MKIDFNNVRVQALNDYNGVVEELHDLINDGDLDKGKVYHLEKRMNDLRSTLVGIACTYKENDPDFESVIDEVSGGVLLRFNVEENE